MKTKKQDPTADLEAEVSERFEQGQELAAKHAQQRIDLQVRHRDRLLKLETTQQLELAALEKRQLDEVAALWRSQRRRLGPWATGGHWKGEGGRHGSSR